MGKNRFKFVFKSMFVIHFFCVNINLLYAEEIDSINTRSIDIKSPQYGAIGDGIADDTYAINKAFESLSNDSTLYIPKGTYLIKQKSGLKLSHKSNIAIKADDAIFKSANVEYFDREHLTPMFHVNNCTSCLIEGLTFDGTNTMDFDVSALFLEDSVEARIINNEAFGFSGNAAFGEANCIGSLWDGNTARDSRTGSKSRGFWLGNGQLEQFTYNLKVYNNTAFNNSATGIVLYSEGSSALNNTSSYNDGSGIIHGGDEGFQVKNSVVENNVLENNLFYGYQNDSYAGFGEYVLSDVLVNNNKISGNKSGGILINDSINQVVSNNIIRNNFGPGIVLERSLSNVKIIDNKIINDGNQINQIDGVQANLHSSMQEDIAIIGNTIDSPSRYAIEIQTVTSDSSIRNISIVGNMLKNSDYGLYCANQGRLSNLKLVDNVFSGNRVRDIRLTGEHELESVIMKGNLWDHDDQLIDKSVKNISQ